jgi:hypothetical protein
MPFEITDLALKLPAGRREWFTAECSEDLQMKGLTTTSTENDQASFYQRVQERAYALWEADGRPEGRQLDHWTQAELEVHAMPTAATAVESVLQQAEKSPARKSAAVVKAVVKEEAGGATSAATPGSATAKRNSRGTGEQIPRKRRK